MSTAAQNEMLRHRFADAIRAAMKRRGVGQGRLAEACHISQAAVSHYRLAHNVPTNEIAERLAAVLNAPELVSLASEARRHKCDNCGRWFVIDNYRARRYCTVDCSRLAIKKRGQGATARDFRAAKAEKSLEIHRVSVAAMCNACEPEGLCRDGKCPLRAVSPFQFVPPTAIEVDAIRPRTVTAEWIESMRKFNARRWTQEARSDASRRGRNQWDVKSDEERRAHAEATRAGIKKARERAA